MISTQLIVAAPLAVTGGEQQVPVKHTLNAATGAYNLEFVVTNGPTPIPDQPSQPYLEVGSVTTNLADAASQAFARELALNSNIKTSKLKVLPGERTVNHSDVYAANGPSLHVWLNYPKLPAGCVIALWVNEF